jgi:membrane dipeptidase
MTPIWDLHSDLLSYLADQPGRLATDSVFRGSLPQMQAGGVRCQVLAIYTSTGPHSVEKGRAQVAFFQRLYKQTPLDFAFPPSPIKLSSSGPVQILPAFENASSFASETEPFEEILSRLEGYAHLLGRIAYIGLTWDTENRFGGGNRTRIGLKEDGKRLLAWLSGKQIAIDFSHTSDDLAYDILNWMEREQLRIPLLASHSNFRHITNEPRNLPDDLAKELIQRKGLIGLNFFGPFIDAEDPLVLLKHVEWGLALGGHDTLCFGADFFHDADAPLIKEKYGRNRLFYDELGNASVYPHVLELFSKKLGLNEELLRAIAHKNALSFFNH